MLTILLPVLFNAKRQARAIINTGNLHQAVNALNLYAMDNDDHYPESIAAVGPSKLSCNWFEPTKLIGPKGLTVASHWAISEYLRPYIPTADILYCSNGPRKYKYLQAAWDAGDDWNNPDTPVPSDPAGGNYCFYWNYIGYLPNRDAPFVGPKTTAGSRKTSKLMMTDYFGYNHWRSRSKYGSCEKFKHAEIIPATPRLSAYWYRNNDIELTDIDIKMRATYSDGSVQTYSTAEVIPMKRSNNADGTVPYPDVLGSGTFYLPSDAMP